MPDYLYGRVCKIELGRQGEKGSQIEYTESEPISIEFTKEFFENKPAITTVKIYNVNSSTADLCAPKKNGKGFDYPECQISAGYRDNYGYVTLGEIVEYKMESKLPDRILTPKAKIPSAKDNR